MSVAALRSIRLLRPSGSWRLCVAGRAVRRHSGQARVLDALCAPAADGWDDPPSTELGADEKDDAAADVGHSIVTRMLGPVGGQITFGTLTGFCSGYALKQVGRKAAYLVGIAFIFVQGLSYAGYIKIKWAKVKDDLIRAVDCDGDGQITAGDLHTYWSKLVHVLTFQLPSTAGFVSGLALGIRYG